MNETATYEQMRDEYLSRLDKLYDHVRAWVAEFDPDTEITEGEVTLKEEPVEPYEAKTLVIKRPACKPVRLIPRGRWIIGAEGRVDMKSDLGTETLIYSTRGGVVIRVDLITENGNRLEETTSHPIDSEVAEGWVFIQNRRIGLLPSLDKSLFCRLLKVLGE